MSGGYSDLSMHELFRAEAETQCDSMSSDLLGLESGGYDQQRFDNLMRYAHSLKGAARIVGLNHVVDVAHSMEDVFIQQGKSGRGFAPEEVDVLIEGVKLLREMASTPEEKAAEWGSGPLAARSRDYLLRLTAAASEQPPPSVEAEAMVSPAEEGDAQAQEGEFPPAETKGLPDSRGRHGRAVRLASDLLDKLLWAAGENLVNVSGLAGIADEVDSAARAGGLCPEEASRVGETIRQIDHKIRAMAKGLYLDALACRTRPFGDLVPPLRVMVRDLTRRLEKEVTLEIGGETTALDRMLLEKMEAPLVHLLRNALDHGIESPEDRKAAGKAPTGTLRLEAIQQGGGLLVRLRDDGRGIDAESIRAKVVERGLLDEGTAAHLSDEEIFEFLFLPGFSLCKEVTEISGRGVGLDVVQAFARDVRGSVRISSRRGEGTEFTLRLPLSLSICRVLVVEIAGHPYAIQIERVERVLRCPVDQVEVCEGRSTIRHDEERVGVIAAGELLGAAQPHTAEKGLSLVLLSGAGRRFALLVDDFTGQGEVLLQPLEPKLGKIRNFSAACILWDGSPCLILDTDDLLASATRVSQMGTPSLVTGAQGEGRIRKRVLVVDDSLTVRELERKLLSTRGYTVETAVDGLDGWNAIRRGDFDLLVTDVDMPRMDGIELTRMVRMDPRLRDVPVVIVSYKDRAEDKQRGMDAGADYYLAKSSFHDEALASAVESLIGAAETS